MKRFSLIYLAGYLMVGGLAFAFTPKLALELFFSTGAYDHVMIRVAGMFMMVLSGMLASMVRRGDFAYYKYTVFARTFITFFLAYIYLVTRDRMFLILIAIVLSGLLPSYYVVFKERQQA